MKKRARTSSAPQTVSQQSVGRTAPKPPAAAAGLHPESVGAATRILTGSAPRWRRMPEARPAGILCAALEAFVDNGYAATRLEDIAERAGVSKGTLYLYFENKEALFKAAVRENIVPLIERAERRVEDFQGSSRDLLVAVVRGWWDSMHESRLTGIPKLVLAESANFPDAARVYFDEVTARMRALLARVLRRGIESGEFRPIDVDYAVRVIMAPISMALIWKHSMVRCQIDGIDLDRHLNAHLDIVLNGVERAPAGIDKDLPRRNQ